MTTTIDGFASSWETDLRDLPSEDESYIEYHPKEYFDDNINGQGYCSFLNSIVSIVFRCYMEKYATYDPGFVVIDTPLPGLDQGVSDATPESMRTALFNFFISHQHDGQIIILENIRHIPKIEYEKAGANVITFTKGLEPGRYGFLLDVQ